MNNAPIPLVSAANASDAAHYIQSRVDEQISWYEKRSSKLKWRYRMMKIISILCSASIPVLISMDTVDNKMKYIAAFLGATVTAVEGISGLLKDKDTFLSFRSASEALLREKMRFQSGTSEDYSKSAPENFKKFVSNCESIMQGENAKWLSAFTQESSQQGGK